MREVEPRPTKMIDCRWWHTANRQSDFWSKTLPVYYQCKIMFLDNCFCDIVVQSIFSSETQLKNILGVGVSSGVTKGGGGQSVLSSSSGLLTPSTAILMLFSRL
jgi:hypothetical protein